MIRKDFYKALVAATAAAYGAAFYLAIQPNPAFASISPNSLQDILAPPNKVPTPNFGPFILQPQNTLDPAFEPPYTNEGGDSSGQEGDGPGDGSGAPQSIKQMPLPKLPDVPKEEKKLERRLYFV